MASAHSPVYVGCLGIYGRLFAYRERPGRAPLEDFLTEALVDLLGRMPEDRVLGFVRLVLGVARGDDGPLTSAWRPGSEARWSTQRAVAGAGRTDVLLELDGRPFLVVESKVGAPVGGRSGPRTPETPRDQLAAYGEWIAGAADPAWGGAVVLLTHRTRAPDAFLSDDGAYRGRHRAVARWSSVARWLAEGVEAASDVRADWVSLSADLAAFLGENGMDSELATPRDWASLQVHLASADRIRASVTRVWEACEPSWRAVCQQRHYAVETSTEYGCVWIYRYLSRSDLKEAYLAVGVRCPSRDGYLHGIVPDEAPYLFVEVGSERGGEGLADPVLPAEWIVGEALWLARRPMHALPADAADFVAEAAEWAAVRVAEAAAALVGRTGRG